MAARRNLTWRTFVAALVVATGVAVAWGLIAGWSISLVESFASSHPKVVESLMVSADGTPVVSVQSNELSSRVTLSRRTMDGKDWPIDYEHWLGSAYLAPRRPEPGLIQVPIRWPNGGRIGGVTDGRRPPTAWYIVRDDKPAGHCYLAGFDAISKLPVGFIGRNGFRAAEPAIEEQFALPDTNEQLSAYAESAQYADWYNAIPQFYDMDEEGRPRPWFVYVTESDKLWEIDLRKRTARIALEMPGLLSVEILTALKSTVDAPATEGAVELENRPGFRLVATNVQDAALFSAPLPANTFVAKEPPKYSGVIALRTDDEIVLFESSSGNKREFKLPKQVPNERISVFWVVPELVLLLTDRGYWSGGPIHQLLWVKPDGSVEREAELKLSGWVPGSPRANPWRMCGAVPVSIAWLVGTTIASPLVMLQNHSAPDYGTALSQTMHIAWPPLVIVLVIAAALTWATVRLQQRYRRAGTAAWSTFVFLLGLPGFLAYLIENRRPKLETCSECGKIVPRDRDVCAACETPFPAPARVGTEIFA